MIDQHGLAAHGLRHELLRRRAHDRGPAADLVRRALHEAAVGLQQVRGGVDREEQHPAVEQRPDLVQLELEAGHDAEVAAAALERPEQVRVAVRAGDQKAPVRGHDLRGQQAVNRKAVLALEPSASAAEREPADARVRQPAARDGEAECLGLPVELAPVGAAAAPGRAPLRVHAHAVHRPQVDHQAAVHHSVPGHRVAAAPHGDLEPVLASHAERRDHVRHAGAARDQRGPAVDRRVEDAP